MAELAIVRVSLKLAWNLIANRAIKSLESGDVVDEKLRQLLLSEFRKLHEQLNALRRKELVAAVAFMENGYQLLQHDYEEARKEFNKARDSAQVALGVVSELQDKILATKIMVVSCLHEFEAKPEVAVSLCIKYVSRLNSIPEVQKACEVALGMSFSSKLKGFSGSTSRLHILGSVSEINRCIWEYIHQDSHNKEDAKAIEWPNISMGSLQIDPLTSFILLRHESSDPIYLPSNSRCPVAMVTANKQIFFAESQVEQSEDQLLANCLKVVDLETGNISSLTGHAKPILSIATVIDESFVITGSTDKQLIVWDTRSLKCHKILSGHTGAIRAIVVNDNFLFSSSTDRTIKVWSHNTFELSHDLVSHNGPVFQLVVSNRHLFSYTLAGGIEYWDLKKWECIHFIAMSPVVPDMHIISNYLVVHYNEEIKLINLGNMKECGKISQVGKNSIVLGNNIVCFEGSEIKCWNIGSLKSTCATDLSKSDKKRFIKCVCYDKNCGKLYVATQSALNNENIILSF